MEQQQRYQGEMAVVYIRPPVDGIRNITFYLDNDAGREKVETHIDTDLWHEFLERKVMGYEGKVDLVVDKNGAIEQFSPVLEQQVEHAYPDY